jgi:PEP-CTERM motif-containing protein
MPEPGTLLLLGTGLLATHLAGRKLRFVFNFLHGQFVHVHGVLLGLFPRSK